VHDTDLVAQPRMADRATVTAYATRKPESATVSSRHASCRGSPSAAMVAMAATYRLWAVRLPQQLTALFRIASSVSASRIRFLAALSWS
jgi:hypothetical protein